MSRKYLSQLRLDFSSGLRHHAPFKTSHISSSENAIMPSCFTVFVHVVKGGQIPHFSGIVRTKEYQVLTRQLKLHLCELKPQ